MKSRIVQPAPSFQPPETCAEHEECRAAQATPEDLRKAALEHYERVTTVAHEWYSVVPRAINAYFDRQIASRDNEVREVLEGLSHIRRYDHGQPERCWCPESPWTHTPVCLAAQRLWEKAQPVKEGKDG